MPRNPFSWAMTLLTALATIKRTLARLCRAFIRNLPAAPPTRDWRINKCRRMWPVSILLLGGEISILSTDDQESKDGVFHSQLGMSAMLKSGCRDSIRRCPRRIDGAMRRSRHGNWVVAAYPTLPKCWDVRRAPSNARPVNWTNFPTIPLRDEFGDPEAVEKRSIRATTRTQSEVGA